MNKEQINLVIPESWDPSKPVQIEIRDGAAAPIRERRNYAIVGNINSISEFVNKRKFNDDPKENPELVIFSANIKKPFIKLSADESDPLGAAFSVYTELKENPELKPWYINEDVYFTQPELKNLIRKYAHHFPDMKVAEDLIKQMDNFTAKFETEVKRADDRRGNSEDIVKDAIKFTKGMMPERITIALPLFEGGRKVVLDLGIEIQRRDDTSVAEFGFFCLTLQTELREQCETLIYEQIELLKPKFVTIEQP